MSCDFACLRSFSIWIFGSSDKFGSSDTYFWPFQKILIHTYLTWHANESRIPQMKIPQIKNLLRKWELYSFPPTLSGSLSNGQSLSQPKSPLRPNSPLYQSCRFPFWFTRHLLHNSTNYQHWCICYDFFGKLGISTLEDGGIYRHIQIRKLLRILLRIFFFFLIKNLFLPPKKRPGRHLLFCLPLS